jgi:hypothetical protein
MHAHTDKAIQDQGSVIGCYGCGPDNIHGLRLKSYWRGDIAIAHFIPQPFHCAGQPDIVYGGLLASLIDCHSCNFAIAHHYALEKREIGSDPKIFCVTAQLNVSYRKPVMIDKPIELVARYHQGDGKTVTGRKVWVECDLSSGGHVCVTGEALIIRVEPASSKNC